MDTDSDEAPPADFTGGFAQPSTSGHAQQFPAAAPATQAARQVLGSAQKQAEKLAAQKARAKKRGGRGVKWGQMFGANAQNWQLPPFVQQLWAEEDERSGLIIDSRDKRIQSPYQGWLLDEIFLNAQSGVSIQLWVPHEPVLLPLQQRSVRDHDRNQPRRCRPRQRRTSSGVIARSKCSRKPKHWLHPTGHPIVVTARNLPFGMSGCQPRNGRRSHPSSMVGPNAARSTTAPWAAALVINVAKSTLVSSVVKTTLGTATTELITPARWTWIDHLAHGL